MFAWALAALLFVGFSAAAAPAEAIPLLSSIWRRGSSSKRGRRSKRSRTKRRRHRRRRGVPQVVENKRRGLKRERKVIRQRKLMHPLSSVQTERTLLTKDGKPAIDPKTGESRRFDVVVVGPTGRVRRLIEITSKTADKRGQEAKAKRIFRSNRKLYIRDQRSGKLRRVRRGRTMFLRRRIRTKRLR